MKGTVMVTSERSGRTKLAFLRNFLMYEKM